VSEAACVVDEGFDINEVAAGMGAGDDNEPGSTDNVGTANDEYAVNAAPVSTPRPVDDDAVALAANDRANPPPVRAPAWLPASRLAPIAAAMSSDVAPASAVVDDVSDDAAAGAVAPRPTMHSARTAETVVDATTMPCADCRLIVEVPFTAGA